MTHIYDNGQNEYLVGFELQSHDLDVLYCYAIYQRCALLFWEDHQATAKLRKFKCRQREHQRMFNACGLKTSVATQIYLYSQQIVQKWTWGKFSTE